jgi:hypothetical protein
VLRDLTRRWHLGLVGDEMTLNSDGGVPDAESARDPLRMINGEGIITGTVVSAAAIAATAGHLTADTRLIFAVVGSVVIYWLAHVHARTLGDAVRRRTHPVSALRESLSETWPILVAALLPIGILVIADLAGAPVRTAAWIAVIASAGLLAVYSFLAGRRGGLGLVGSLLSACVGAALGILIVVLKAGMH